MKLELQDCIQLVKDANKIGMDLIVRLDKRGNIIELKFIQRDLDYFGDNIVYSETVPAMPYRIWYAPTSTS